MIEGDAPAPAATPDPAGAPPAAPAPPPASAPASRRRPVLPRGRTPVGAGPIAARPADLRARRVGLAVVAVATLLTLGTLGWAARHAIPVGKTEARERAHAFGRVEALRVAAGEGGTAIGTAGEVFVWNDAVATAYELSVVVHLPGPRRLRVVRFEAVSHDDRTFDVRRSFVLDDVALLPSEDAATVARLRLGERFHVLDGP